MRSGRIPATLIHAIMPLRTNKPLIASFSRLVKQKRLFYSFCQYPIAHTHVTDHGIKPHSKWNNSTMYFCCWCCCWIYLFGLVYHSPYRHIVWLMLLRLPLQFIYGVSLFWRAEHFVFRVDLLLYVSTTSNTSGKILFAWSVSNVFIFLVGTKIQQWETLCEEFSEHGEPLECEYD